MRRLSSILALALAILPAGDILPRSDEPHGSLPDISASTLQHLYAGPPTTWPRPALDAGIAFVEFASPPRAPPMDDRERELAALGERLFFDPQLSGSGTVACSHCHDPRKGWGDGRATSIGAWGRTGRRNAPPLFDGVHGGPWGWTGRFDSLRAQLIAPLFDPREMANDDSSAIVRRIEDRPDYRAAFARAFEPGAGVALADIAGALAAYLRGRDEPTRFDAFLSGDRSVLSATELEGLHLFRTKARCANCHFGPRLSDGAFHNLRLSFFGEPAQDLGRHETTGLAEDAGRFRTPSLRHVSRTGPYMHNGLLSDLRGVIHFYDRGGGEVWARNASEAAHPLYPHAARLSPHIRPLGLSAAEKTALLAFLGTL